MSEVEEAPVEIAAKQRQSESPRRQGIPIAGLVRRTGVKSPADSATLDFNWLIYQNRLQNSLLSFVTPSSLGKCVDVVVDE